MEAAHYIVQEHQVVRCQLCPHLCRIPVNHTGLCGVRRNINGILFSENYGIISAAHLDPIEKKPLKTYYPGSYIYSIGSIGCNLRCAFCQNWEISQARVDDHSPERRLHTPEEIIKQAKLHLNKGNIGIAYTYNEPIVWYEFMRDCAILAQQANLKNIMVSNGYITPNALQELLPLIDAYNIDLKGDDSFYHRLTQSNLNPVKQTLETISNYGAHLEISYLVIPEENDDPIQFKKTMDWLSSHVCNDVVIHINRYFPHFHFKREATPLSTLYALAEVASRTFTHVYIGNI